VRERVCESVRVCTNGFEDSWFTSVHAEVA